MRGFLFLGIVCADLLTDITLKLLGCFKPNLGQIWTNPNVGLKM